MSKTNEFATLILAADRLNESGKLDTLMAIFNADPVLTAATNDKRHRATAKKAGKVIVRNDRQRTVASVERAANVADKPVATPMPVEAPYGFKADGVTPRKRPVPVAALAALAAKREAAKQDKPVATPTVKPTVVEITPVADKPAGKPSGVNNAGKVMLSGANTATRNQVKWLVANSNMTNAQARKLSMLAASNLRAKLTGKIA
jgi:hypothetical protein